VGKPEGKRLLRRLYHRLENNIRMDVREIGWEGVEWIHVAQNRDEEPAVVNTVMNLDTIVTKPSRLYIRLYETKLSSLNIF
jgi:hypothetical protein